jgi:gliding motility-associated lipoprotein GldD
MKRILYLLSSLILICSSCLEEQVSMPKPRGYYRIDLPEKSYQPYEGPCPYRFEFPRYAVYEADTLPQGESCRANISIQPFKAKLHLTYKAILGNLTSLSDDSRTLAYRHSVRASGIKEYLIDLPEHKVYGIIYEIGGDAASSIQFHVSDSSKHFLRGSLYFFAAPNADSLAPVVNFLRTDIEHMLKSFRWTN